MKPQLSCELFTSTSLQLFSVLTICIVRTLYLYIVTSIVRTLHRYLYEATSIVRTFYLYEMSFCYKKSIRLKLFYSKNL